MHNCIIFDEKKIGLTDGIMDKKFNIRVYGVCIKNSMVLLSDERLRGFEFTKFPGGGLEFGEGTIDCLKREMREETGNEFSVISHFYTTDFFQESAFHPSHQIVSVYYIMEGTDIPSDLLKTKKFDFDSDKSDQQFFRWVKLAELTDTDVTFPIDKIVVDLIKNQFS